MACKAGFAGVDATRAASFLFSGELMDNVFASAGVVTMRVEASNSFTDYGHLQGFELRRLAYSWYYHGAYVSTDSEQRLLFTCSFVRTRQVCRPLYAEGSSSTVSLPLDTEPSLALAHGQRLPFHWESCHLFRAGLA